MPMMIRTTRSSMSVKPPSSRARRCRTLYISSCPFMGMAASGSADSVGNRDVSRRMVVVAQTGLARTGRPGRPVAITEAADRLDRRRAGCVGVELSPQIADVELHLVAGGREVVSPDELAELVVAQHLVRVGHEGDQEPELQACQRNFAPGVVDGALRERDAEPAVGVRLLRSIAARAAKEDVDARDQLLPSERLD